MTYLYNQTEQDTYVITVPFRANSVDPDEVCLGNQGQHPRLKPASWTSNVASTSGPLASMNSGAVDANYANCWLTVPRAGNIVRLAVVGRYYSYYNNMDIVIGKAAAIANNTAGDITFTEAIKVAIAPPGSNQQYSIIKGSASGSVAVARGDLLLPCMINTGTTSVATLIGTLTIAIEATGTA